MLLFRCLEAFIGRLANESLGAEEYSTLDRVLG